MLGAHPIRVYSKTQSLIALSSAESEFYGTLKAATESIGVLSLFEDLGRSCKVEMRVDASDALGVVQRRGVGKFRHLHTGSLWIQEQKLRDVISFSKTPGSDNLADLFTKNVGRSVCEKHMAGIGCTFQEGRAGAAAQLHCIQRKIKNAQDQFMNVTLAQDDTIIDSDNDFDWSNADDHSIDSLIVFVEAKKDEQMKSACEAWSERVMVEVMQSTSGMTCTRCGIGGEGTGWQDHWGHRHGNASASGVWTRHHTKPRCSLFTPCKVNNGPKDLDSIIGTRVTIGKYEDGRSFFHVDDWKDEAMAHQKLEARWTGTTFFHELVSQAVKATISP